MYHYKVTDDVFKIKANSNVYVIKSLKTVIDTGIIFNKELVKKGIEEIMPLEEIKTVIFTHLHYDHSGNHHLFPNAKFYASKKEIEDFKKNPEDSTLNPEIKKDKPLVLYELKDTKDFKIIPTPGHTRGSVSIFYEKEGILFSGDTMFYNDGQGRTDLPTSVPGKMQESVEKLKKMKFKILCPGHEY